MSKLLVVFGATGQQGGSVVKTFLRDSSLSKQYKIRALTRDNSKPASKALQEEGAEVVLTDNEDPASIHKGLRGAHAVFLNLPSMFQDGGREAELRQGKLIADAALAEKVQYFIYSGSTNCTKNTNGRLTQNWIYDVKAQIEEYIRTLPMKSIFYIPASFMQNFQGQWKPRPAGDGTYNITSIVAPTTELPFIDITDTGSWVAGILADPEQYVGKNLRAATGWFTCEQLTQTVSKATGKTVVFKQIPDEVFKGFLPPARAENLIQMMQYNRDYHYFGDKSPDYFGVEWASKQAMRKPTTFEEYLQKDPLQLD